MRFILVLFAAENLAVFTLLAWYFIISDLWCWILACQLLYLYGAACYFFQCNPRVLLFLGTFAIVWWVILVCFGWYVFNHLHDHKLPLALWIVYDVLFPIQIGPIVWTLILCLVHCTQQTEESLLGEYAESNMADSQMTSDQSHNK